MGLAQRFKNKIDDKDIFKVSLKPQDHDSQNIKFISKPIEKTQNIPNSDTQKTSAAVNIIPSTQNILLNSERNQAPISTSSQILGDNSNQYINKFGDFETQIIEKIRKTPYWQEYGLERQTHMIEAYFNRKFTAASTSDERKTFIRTILDLTTNE